MDTLKTKKYIFSKGIDSYFEGIHKRYQFTIRFFKEAFTRPFHWREIINQCFEIGLKSLSLITVKGYFKKKNKEAQKNTPEK
jgi:phospholipid/cholesterol/gamma-HCH transport system permease protein